MRLLLLAVAAALAPPQDPAGTPPEACVLKSIEEKEGVYEAAFSSPWPKESSVRLEVARRTTHMSWAPWVEKDARGEEVERVNLSVRNRERVVHRDLIRIGKDGGFTVTWKPKLPGVYHLRIVYDPGQQDVPDPRFRRESRTVHRLMALASGGFQELLIEDGREAVRFADKFFVALRAALENSANDQELEEKMRKYTHVAVKRGAISQHPGTYSVMENLSPYFASVPKDPEKDGSDDPQKLVPNLLDLKTALLPPAVIRESIVLAILLMEDALEESLLLAPLRETQAVGIRRSAAERIAAELPEAVEGLRKLEPASRLARLWRVTELDKLMTEGSGTIKRMLEKRESDEASVKLLVGRLKAAVDTIGHPRESLKE